MRKCLTSSGSAVIAWRPVSGARRLAGSGPGRCVRPGELRGLRASRASPRAREPARRRRLTPLAGNGGSEDAFLSGAVRAACTQHPGCSLQSACVCLSNLLALQPGESSSRIEHRSPERAKHPVYGPPSSIRPLGTGVDGPMIQRNMDRRKLRRRVVARGLETTVEPSRAEQRERAAASYCLASCFLRARSARAREQNRLIRYVTVPRHAASCLSSFLSGLAGPCCVPLSVLSMLRAALGTQRGYR